MEVVEIRVPNLHKIDMLEHSDVEGFRFEECKVPDGTHGELTLYTLVLSLTAISALAAYFLKKHDRQSFEESYEIVRADGSSEVRTIKWSASSSEAPEADLIEQIRKGL